MADTLVERGTGQAVAAAVPVEVHLVMTDQAMFSTGEGRDEPAHLDGYGPIPAELARPQKHQSGDMHRRAIAARTIVG